MHRSPLPRILLLLTLIAWVEVPAIGQGRTSARKEVAEVVQHRVDAALDQLQTDGDFETAELALVDLFDQVIAHAQNKQGDAFRAASSAVRLVRQLGAADESLRLELLSYLRENPRLMRGLVFLVKPQEDPPKVYAMLDRLRKARGDKLDAFATLAAAVCVVHDEPMSIRINENVPRSINPIDIFDFYVQFEKQMYYGIRDVPAELLVYVVDTTASADEMAWSLQRYAGDHQVARRYFEIEYDIEHFKKGTPKKSSAAGWGLRNILQYGGVCADQAYFAMTVGKSIGVPTAYTIGASADVSHAWVGYLQSNGRRVAWNFNTGRYEAYQGVKGRVRDPQTRKTTPDSHISLLADMSMFKVADRQVAAAMVDAAQRLREVAAERISKFDPEPFPDGTRGIRRQRRTTGIDSQLDLIEQGLRRCSGYAPGWFAVRDTAVDGQMPLKKMQQWAQTLDRLCGGRYPDFSLAVLGPMIESVQDIKTQNALWNRAFDSFRDRPDLAAEVRLAQAQMWRSVDDIERAGRCYEDVIGRYASAGPFVVKALQQAEELLREAGLEDRIPALYGQTWARTTRPKDGSAMFLRGGVWYQVGARYAKKLEEAGYHQQAAGVMAQLQGQ